MQPNQMNRLLLAEGQLNPECLHTAIKTEKKILKLNFIDELFEKITLR